MLLALEGVWVTFTVFVEELFLFSTLNVSTDF